MTLNKADIFSAKRKLLEVEVTEWGGTVFIRPLTLAQQAKLADNGIKNEDSTVQVRMKDVMLPLILWSVVDENGDRIFDDSDKEKLMDTPASALLALQEKILDNSGLTAESRAELEKNLKTAPDSSPSLQ